MPSPNSELSGVGVLVGMHVLIAEDLWELADNMAVHLEEQGARVLRPFAASANALDCVRSRKIDFALVDMNSIDDFADDLMVELADQRVPCAVITGYEALPSNAMSLAVKVFQKPVEMRVLIDLISGYRSMS